MPIAILVVLAIIGAIVGPQDANPDDGESTEAGAGTKASDDLDDAVANDESSDDGAGGDGGGAQTPANAKPESMAEYEELWASERQAIIDELNSGEYGLGSDGIVRGPAGFELDTLQCPSDWLNDDGIRDGSIQIGLTAPLSGSLAAYGTASVAIDAYFARINESGGIGPSGLSVELSVKDDAYVAIETVESVNELLTDGPPFVVHTLGTPPTFAVHDTLNEVCVPQPMVFSGHPAWGDPVNHPWTTGLQLSYSTEAELWVRWIEQNLDAPVTVAALVADNDIGLAYESSFRLAGAPCLMAVQEAAASGLTESARALFYPSICADVPTYVAPSGDAADGWLIVGSSIRANTDPALASDPWMAFMNGELESAGLDPSVDWYSTGFGQFAWPLHQALEIAANLDGGLSRTNLILAQRGMTEMTHPMFVDGIHFGVNGNDDAFFIEGSGLDRFDADRQEWVHQEIIDLNGQTPNCPWDIPDGCAD